MVDDTAGVSRRELLGAGALAGTVSLAGCLGGNTESLGEFEPEPPVNAGSLECPESEVLEENVRLRGRLTSALLGSSGKEWDIVLEAGEELNVNLYLENPRADYRLPSLEILDPDGEALVDVSQPSANIHSIAADTDGAYTVRINNRPLVGTNDYIVRVTWFGGEGCATHT